MNLSNKTAVLWACLMCSMQSQADTLPVEVSLTRQGNTPVIYVEAVTDRIKVISYQVNRGNCQASSIHRMPVDIVFGGRLQIIAPMCNVKEVTITTDKGKLAYTF